MTLGRAILFTAIWVVLVLGIGIAIAVSLSDQPNAEERAGMLGSGMGMLCAIGVAAIWGIFFIQKQQAEKDKAKKKKSALKRKRRIQEEEE